MFNNLEDTEEADATSPAVRFADLSHLFDQPRCFTLPLDITPTSRAGALRSAVSPDSDIHHVGVGSVREGAIAPVPTDHRNFENCPVNSSRWANSISASII